MIFILLIQLYPPGQDEYLYIMKDKRSGFPLDCYKYNRYVIICILKRTNWLFFLHNVILFITCYFIFSSAVDAFDPDMKTYPMFDKAASIMFEQLPGEILFIPSGWFHQVFFYKDMI